MSSSNLNFPFAARITGTGSAFPERRMSNDEIGTFLETNDEWIRERTGIRERRVADIKNPAELNSSLGLRAAQQALEMAGKTANDIDQILYATCTPDTLIPSTACWLQHKLGATRASAVDLNAACSGFIYGLSMADQFIKTGHSKTTLVIGAELTTQFVNWKDRGSCILFGDGAGAAIIERTSPDSPHRIFSTHLGSDGNLWDLFYMPGGGSNMEITEEVRARGDHKMKMKGKEIFKIAVKTLADYAGQALDANGLKLSDVDWVIPHQANLRIIEATAKRLDFPMDRVLVNVDRYGNTSAATVPTALDEAVRDGRIKPGHVVLMTVFGAGLTYGSAVMRF
jgi:3-oxoacyl-[acyl-carrier-protein] synthase-3